MNPKAVAFYDFLSDRLENKKVYAESFDDDELDRVDKENTKSACAGILTGNFDELTSSILDPFSRSSYSDFLNRMLDILEEK